MSLTTHEYGKQNYQLKQPNYPRRYILEPPIRKSNKHKQQIKIENSSKTKEYFRPNLTKSSFYRINEDPWVKELLERDIDFSELAQQEEQIQFLNIPNINNSKSISQHYPYHQFNNQQNLQKEIKRSSQSPFIINDKSKRTDQYQPIYPSQTNHPSRQWIFQQSTNSNDFPIYKDNFNSTQFSSRSNNYKNKSINNKQSQYHKQ